MNIVLLVGAALMAAAPQPAAAKAPVLRGTISWSHRSVNDNFTHEQTVTVTGKWRAGGTAVCAHTGVKVDPKAQSFRGLDGMLTWTESMENSERPAPPTDDHEKEALRHQIRSYHYSASKRITFTEDENDRYVFSDPAATANARGSLGCVTLDAKKGQLYIKEPWWNPVNNIITVGEVKADVVNQLGEPWHSDSPHYNLDGEGPYNDGKFDPKALPEVHGHYEHREPNPEGGQAGYSWEEIRWDLTLRDDPKVELSGPECVCGDHQVAEWTARTGMKDGKFEKFEVVSDGKSAVVQDNTGGDKPHLAVLGSGSVGKTKIVAVYRRADGTLERSDPLEVHFADIDPIKLKVTRGLAHGNGRDICWGDDGELELEASSRAWFDGKEVSSDIEWSLRPDGERLFHSEPSVGKKVRFEATAMPTSNRELGKKQVVALVMGASRCACNEQKDVRLFFPRDGDQNPGGQAPNWAYYWAQTRAGKGIPFTYTGENTPAQTACGPSLFAEPEPDYAAAAHYDFCTDEISLADVNQKGCYPRFGQGEEDTGIDCLAVALRHEQQHQVEMTSWWGRGLSKWSMSEDSDSDLVPNRVEIENGCNPKGEFSCPSRVDKSLKDREFDAYQVSWRSWKRGSADDEDWAYPGKQWTKNAP